MLVSVCGSPCSSQAQPGLRVTTEPGGGLEGTSFGTGIYFCLGHQLARAEGKCALEALFGRWPQLELAVPPDAIRWRQRPGLRAIDRLPVALPRQ